jgi:hypothetical protein
VFRESAETVEQSENLVLDMALTDLADLAGLSAGDESEADLSRHLLHAVETYKAACAVAGEAPTQEDAWLVLLSALQLEDAK